MKKNVNEIQEKKKDPSQQQFSTWGTRAVSRGTQNIIPSISKKGAQNC